MCKEKIFFAKNNGKKAKTHILACALAYGHARKLKYIFDKTKFCYLI